MRLEGGTHNPMAPPFEFIDLVYLTDQLLLPMALAGGGSFTTSIPDDHVLTNLAVIEKFLPVKSSITELDRGLRMVSMG